MANRFNRAELLVDFKSEGLSDIEKEIKQLQKNIKGAVELVNSLKVSPQVFKQFNILENQLSILKNRINLFKTTLGNLKDQKINNSDLERINKELINLISQVGRTKQTFEVLKQGIGQTTQGLNALIKKELEEIATLTKSRKLVDSLKNEYRELNSIKDNGIKLGKLQVFKKDIEDRIALINEFNKELKSIKSLPVSKGLKKELTKPFTDFRREINNSKISVDKLAEDFKKLKEVSKELQASFHQFKTLSDKLFDLKMLGMSEDKLKGLKKQINDTLKKSIELKNSKLFTPLIKEVQSLESEYKSLYSNAKKFNALYLDTLTNLQKASLTKGLNPTIIAQFKNELESLYETTKKTGDAQPLATLNRELKQMINTSFGIEKAKETFNSLVKELKKVGVEDKVIKDLEKDFNELAKTSKIFGNTKPLGNLLRNMRQLKKEGGDLNKINLYLEEIDRQFIMMTQHYKVPSEIVQKLKNEFNEVKNKALELNDVSLLRNFNSKLNKTIDTTIKLKDNLYETGSAYKMLAGVMVDLSNAENRNIIKMLNDYKKLDREIERSINKYKALVQNLKIQLSSRQNFAKSSDIKKAKELLSGYEAELEKLLNIQREVRNNIRAGSINTKSFANLKSAVSNVNEELTTMDLKLQEVKAKLQETGIVKFISYVTKMAIAYSALYMGIYQVTNVIQRGVGFVVEMDKATHQLSAIFNLSYANAKLLEGQLVRLGVAFGGDVKDINEVALSLGRAGIETKNLVQATEYVIKMAKLTGDSFESSANAMISFMTVYKNVKGGVKELADELAYMANASRLSTEDINTFANYALEAAKSANVTRHMIEALAIAFSNAGMNASTIGTSIRRLTTLMTDNSTAVKRFFDKLGISQEVFAKITSRSTKDSERMWKWLIKRISQMSQSEFQDALGNMEVLARQSLSALRNNSTEVLNQIKILNQGVNGEIDTANTMLDSYIGTWERVKNSVGLAFSSLLESLMPTIQELGNKLVYFINLVNEKMPIIIENLKIFAKVLATIMAMLVVSKVVAFGKALVTSFSMATASAITFSGVLSTIGRVLGAIGGFFARNPIILVLTVAAGLAYTIYKSVTNTNDAYREQNTLLQQQNKLNSLIAYHDKLIADRERIKRLLAEAIVNHDKERINLYTQLLNKIETELEEYNNIIKKQQKKVNLQKEEVEKAQKFVEYQLLSAKLERLNARYMKEPTKELERQIQLIELKLQKLKEFANYKPPKPPMKQISVFAPPPKPQIPNMGGVVVKNPFSTWKNGFVETNVEVKSLKTNIDDLIGKGQRVLQAWDMSKVLNQTDEFSRKLKALREQQLALRENLPSLVSDDELQRLSILAGKLKEFEKAGLNVTDLFKNLNKFIELAFRKSLKNIGGMLHNNLLQSGVNLANLPKPLEKQLQKVQYLLDTITNPKDLPKLEAEIVRLTILFESLGGTLDKNVKGSLNAIIKVLNQKMQKVDKLVHINVKAKLDKKSVENLVYHIPKDKLKLKSIFNLEDFGQIEEEINRLASKYANEIRKTKQLLNGEETPIRDELSEAQKKLNSLDGMYSTFYSKRIAKEKEYRDLVGEIRAQNLMGFKDEKKAQELLRQKTQLESELKKLYRNEEEYKKKILQVEIQIEEIKQRQLLAQKKLRRETAETLDENLKWYFSLNDRLKNIRQEIGLIKLNKTAEKSKLDDYFNFYTSQIIKKQKELKQHLFNLQSSQFDYSGLNTNMGNVSNLVGDYKHYQDQIKAINDYYEQKKLLIKEKENEINQMLATGQISEVQAVKIKEQLKTEAVKNATEKRKMLLKNEQMATLSMLSGMLGSFNATFYEFMQAGYAKNKRWFQVYKKLRVAQTIIDTYASAQKAMAQLPYPINFVAAGLAVAQGLMRLAIIKAQKFHTGGYVDRNTANQKMGGLKDDEIPAILQKGEYVLSKEEVKAIKSSNSNNTRETEIVKPEVVIINSVDFNTIGEYMQSRKGREIIKNIVKT